MSAKLPLGRLTPALVFACTVCVLGALLTTAGPALAQTYNQIQFVITTGSDDLRGDSSATATLKSPSGATLQVVELKSQHAQAWPNGTVNRVTAQLSPTLTRAAIGSVAITLTSHNGFGESDDNWNVNGVAAMLYNGGNGPVPLLNGAGTPLKRLTGKDGTLTLAAQPLPPPGAFNQIEFTIVTGDDDLRGDSSATAALQSASGAILQMVQLKGQSDPSWPNGSTKTVIAPLVHPLKPYDIAHIMITLTSHNGPGETDDNWNVNSVTASLSVDGVGLQQLLTYSGNPLQRLTGTRSSLILPPIRVVAGPIPSGGLGMTMPIDPGPEPPNLNLDPSIPNGELPFGYKLPPAGFVDASSKLSHACSPATQKACLPAWNGQASEQDGRLNAFLRANAAAKDARLLLGRAVWLALSLELPGSVKGMACGGSDAECSTALAQLAVTGREAFTTFATWNPAFAPASTGPQVDDLVRLVQQPYRDLPALPNTVSSAQLRNACTEVLTEAYTALWAIRSNDPVWREFRLNSGWIAVSSEDDAPHRPVNVFTAPFPQFDIPVPVTIDGRAFTLTARYMVAARQTLMNVVPGPAATRAPPIPVVATPAGSSCPAGTNPCPPRLTIPHDQPSALLGGELRRKNVIVYIHGGGSRLEEAAPMAEQFVSQFGTWSDNVIVISFDLPNSGYDDPMVTAVNGSQRLPLDASSSSFENGPDGKPPTNVKKLPVLNFTLNFINNMIRTLDSEGVLNAHQVLAVMGGSLGGNTSLLLGANPLPPPLHLENPLAFSAPPASPGGAHPTVVSWSPTSMVSEHDNVDTVIGGAMCCSILASLPPTSSKGWEAENATKTRPDYFNHLYFDNTGPGLPADPEMWYRDDWTDSHGHSATTSFITQSRFDRYEIYSGIVRLWTTSIDTEQVVFSFQDNTDTTGHTFRPVYQDIRARLLLASGACDDYDNANSTAAFAPPPAISTGSCANHGLGNTGSNVLVHQDIYGFTHDIANDMRNATGRTLFLIDTGHSIHDEHPKFFAKQIFDFLTTSDNNVNITLWTGSDDLRWNSEAHAVIGIKNTSQGNETLDFPLNYWFHPWPATSKSPNNPCGACYKLTSFHFASGSNGATTENNFTIALPAVAPTAIDSFNLEFIAGTSSIGNTTDNWKLAAVAACLPGSEIGFVSDGFPPNGSLKDFSPSSDNQPIRWQPPSFRSPSDSTLPNNCSATSTNPPADSDVPSGIWNDGFQIRH